MCFFYNFGAIATISIPHYEKFWIFVFHSDCLFHVISQSVE